MLVIRLARTGRTKYPTYRIVAAESARAATSRFVENLGNYNPHTKELILKREEIAVRLSQGAQPSNTVLKLLIREGVEVPAWAKLKTKASKPVEVVTEEVATGDTVILEEVSAAEAAADADGTPAEVVEEVRVAEVAEELATAAEDAEPNIDTTETAAADAEAVAEVKAGDKAAAEAAIDAKA